MRLLEFQTAGELAGGMKRAVAKVRREDQAAERGARDRHRQGSAGGHSR